MTIALRPPGPQGSLLLGNMAAFQRDALEFITACARQHGDVVRTRFLYSRVYFLNHPDHIEYVLQTNNRNFIKPVSLRTPFFVRIAGRGLLTSEGDFWLKQRRLAQPAFHRERINSYGEVMVAYAERMLDGWRDGETHDIHQEMMRLTLEIVARTLFDADVTDAADEVGEALEVVVEPFASQATIKWILDNHLPTNGNRRFHRAVDRLDRIIYRIISERHQSKRDHGDLLSMLLQATDEAGVHMTDQQLRDEVITLFLAGHETTALALTWTWYLLGQHSEIEARLHAELQTVLGGRNPVMEDIARLPYTEMVIKEAMRLYPPGWGIGREALKDCEIGGYRVPAGAQVFMFQWVVHRDERFFERANEFQPERWISDSTKRLPRFAYFPFGGGPRGCIGNAFAMMEAALLLATIAQRFRLKLVSDHPVTPLPTITLRPRSGIKVVLEKR
ncbi:MAG: cytochrome P450 [Pyrinomonadaceae bacterium]|nr:cytochrome P450 [Pyrinomonadaceae bacterium]